MSRFQNLGCVDCNKPWEIGSQNRACSLQFTTCHSIMINIVLMIHGSGILICILPYSVDYFWPVNRLCGWVVFISHLNIPQKVPFKGQKSRWYTMQFYIVPSSVFNILFIGAGSSCWKHILQERNEDLIFSDYVWPIICWGGGGG